MWRTGCQRGALGLASARAARQGLGPRAAINHVALPRASSRRLKAGRWRARANWQGRCRARRARPRAPPRPRTCGKLRAEVLARRRRRVAAAAAAPRRVAQGARRPPRLLLLRLERAGRRVDVAPDLVLGAQRQGGHDLRRGRGERRGAVGQQGVVDGAKQQRAGGAEQGQTLPCGSEARSPRRRPPPAACPRTSPFAGTPTDCHPRGAALRGTRGHTVWH